MTEKPPNTRLKMARKLVAQATDHAHPRVVSALIMPASGHRRPLSRARRAPAILATRSAPACRLSRLSRQSSASFDRRFEASLHLLFIAAPAKASQPFKPSNFQTFKLSNFQTFKLSNSQTLEGWLMAQDQGGAI